VKYGLPALGRTYSIGLGGQSPARKTLGISLASGDDFFYTATNALITSGAKAMWIRWRPDEAPPMGTRCILTCNNLNDSTGAAIYNEASPLTGATTGRVAGFCGTTAPNPLQSVKILTPHEYGADRRIRCSIVWLEGGKFHFAEGGYEYGVAGATGLATFNTANRLAINARPSVAPGGTNVTRLPYGAFTVFEVQLSTATFTAADVRAVARAQVGTQWAGAVHHWKPSASWIEGDAAPATWVDSIGGVAFTKGGSTSTIVRHRKGSYSGIPGVQIVADSIGAGRQAGGLLGNGWRRSFQHTLIAGGRLCAIGGVNASTSSTPDFDAQHRALGGQALGVPTINVPTSRLSTLAADVLADCGPDGLTIFAYGANDLNYRVANLAQTPEEAALAYLADIETALGLVRASRSGPVIFVNTLREHSAVAANIREAIDISNEEFSSFIAGLGDSGCTMFDACTLITPTQEHADDTNILIDGVHPSPSAYATYGTALANQVLAMGLP
jgi:lysophospholipase L1-like esterase